MDLFLQTWANAVVASGIYAIIAVGLSIAFGVMRMANLAHGEFYMIGAYVVWLFYAVEGWPFPVAVLMAMLIVGALGLATERLIFRPLRGQIVSGYIATGGLMWVLQVAMGRLFGVGLSKPISPAYPGALTVFGVSVGWQKLLIVPVCLVMMGALWFFLHRIKMGRALRASAQDSEAAALQGISINRMTALAMVIGSVFAGVAGAMMAPVYPITPYMGHAVILVAFIVVIVGGMASIEGTMIAAIIFGFLYTVITTLADGVLASIIAVLVMLVVLAFKPMGLLGKVKA